MFQPEHIILYKTTFIQVDAERYNSVFYKFFHCQTRCRKNYLSGGMISVSHLYFCILLFQKIFIQPQEGQTWIIFFKEKVERRECNVRKVLSWSIVMNFCNARKEYPCYNTLFFLFHLSFWYVGNHNEFNDQLLFLNFYVNI